MNNIYFSILNSAAQAQKQAQSRVQPPKAASAPQPKQQPKPQPKATAAKTAAKAPAKATTQKQSGTDRRNAQLEAVQQKLSAQNSAAKANKAVVINKNDLTPEKIQEIFVWTEILGEPKCRQRHKSRSRRIER